MRERVCERESVCVCVRVCERESVCVRERERGLASGMDAPVQAPLRKYSHRLRVLSEQTASVFECENTRIDFPNAKTRTDWAPHGCRANMARHVQDSQGQILALAFRQKSLRCSLLAQKRSPHTHNTC